MPHQQNLESWFSNPKHKTGGLKKNIHGGDYQLKLLMLFAWRSVNFKVRGDSVDEQNDISVAFRLATEMPEAGKLDDLVFRYGNKTNRRYRFLQAKHRKFLTKNNKITVNDLELNDSDFSLQKYFVSYLTDLQREQFQDGEAEDFIICTNTDFDFEESTTKTEIENDKIRRWKGYLLEKKDEDKILNLGGKRYQFSNDPIKRHEIISDLEQIFEKSFRTNHLSNDNINKINQFLDKLTFAVEQPSGAILDQKIKDEIGEEFNLKNNFIYCSFHKFMYHWIQHYVKDKGIIKAHFLTSKDVKQFFKIAKQEICNLELIGLTKEYEKKIEDFGIDFSEEPSELHDFLISDEKCIFNLVNPHNIILSAIKVHQSLNCNQAYQKDGSYIFIPLSSLVNIQDRVINAFKSETSNNLLVIVCDAASKNVDELGFQLLTESIASRNKIVLITLDFDPLANIFQCYADNEYEEKKDEKNGFFNLTNESQENLLKEEKVVFQGKELSLGMLVDEMSKHLIDGEVLSKLINNEKIVVGIKRPDLSDLDSIYYTTYVAMEENKFVSVTTKSNLSYLFVISGTTRDGFLKFIKRPEFQGGNAVRVFGKDSISKENKFIILTNEYEMRIIQDFKQICSDYPERTVQLIEKKDNKWIWKRCFDASFYIPRKFYHVVIKTDSLREKIHEESKGAEEKKDHEEFKGGEEKKDIFVISSIEKNKFTEQYEINISTIADLSKDDSSKKNHIILENENDEEKFEDFLKHYNIHFLQNIDHKLVWKHSKGSIDQIYDLQDMDNKFIIHDFSKIINTEKAVIITGEPGMGKSTTLTHFLKQSEESEWIIKLKLINLQEQLEKFSDINDLDSITDIFFSKADIGVNERIAEELLKYRIKHVGKIILLFDGFDEITDRNQETVIKLLKFLQKSKAKIQVTTRLNVKDKLESALSLFSYNFQPFSEKNQKEFLQKFWKTSFELTFYGEINCDTLGKIVGELFEHFYKNIKDKNWEFMSIPLLTRMFAEIYQKAVEDSYILGSQVDPQLLEEVEKLTVLDLFEKFVKKKYKIYFKEKIQGENISDYIKNKVTKSLNEDHKCLVKSEIFNNLADRHELLRQTKDLTLVGIIQSINSKVEPYFIHQTFAEYFIAGLLVDMIKSGEENLEYKQAREFLLTQIFRDRNKVIHDFFDNMIKNEQDYNLISKWKEIGNCDLLNTESRRELQLFKLLSVKDGDIQTDHMPYAVSGKSLSELQQEVASHMNWQDNFKYEGGYYYNGDPNLINELFQRFFKETDIVSLKATLQFLANANEKSYFTLANMQFSRNYNITNAAKHYLIQAKQQNMLDEEFVTKFVLEKLIGGYKTFDSNIKGINSSAQDAQKEKYVISLTNFLFSKKPEDIKLLFFFIQIFHQGVIAAVKQNIHKCYEGKDYYFLERDGIKIAKCCAILTSQMSKAFNLILDEPINGNYITGFDTGYASNIFKGLILPFIDMMKEKQLHNVNKLAFLKMLVRFTDFYVEQNMKFSLAFDQLKTILELIETVLEHVRLFKLFLCTREELLESAEYLYLLGKLGLKLITIDHKLLVLDPANEFQYELSCCSKEIVELLKWKRDNPECDLTAALKDVKLSLKRSRSENDLQESTKRFKS